jgi:hypothetical protein
MEALLNGLPMNVGRSIYVCALQDFPKKQIYSKVSNLNKTVFHPFKQNIDHYIYIKSKLQY